MKRTPLWQDAATADLFSPAPGGRVVVKLDAQATQVIVDQFRGAHRHPMFVLLNHEGDLRQKKWRTVNRGVSLADSWPEAMKRARDEGLVIYNARSKKAMRPVWYQVPEARTETNMQLEPVRLIPHSATLDQNADKLPVTARLFHIEGTSSE